MITRLQTSARLAHVVVHGGLAFLSGQVADDFDTDVTEQSRQVLARIDKLLAEAGTDRDAMLPVNIWLRDISDFDRFNAVWDQCVPKDHLPARACVDAAIVDPRIRVEIAVIAAVPA